MEYFKLQQVKYLGLQDRMNYYTCNRDKYFDRCAEVGQVSKASLKKITTEMFKMVIKDE